MKKIPILLPSSQIQQAQNIITFYNHGIDEFCQSNRFKSNLSQEMVLECSQNLIAQLSPIYLKLSNTDLFDIKCNELTIQLHEIGSILSTCTEKTDVDAFWIFEDFFRSFTSCSSE